MNDFKQKNSSQEMRNCFIIIICIAKPHLKNELQEKLNEKKMINECEREN